MKTPQQMLKSTIVKEGAPRKITKGDYSTTQHQLIMQLAYKIELLGKALNSTNPDLIAMAKVEVTLVKKEMDRYNADYSTWLTKMGY